MSRKSRLVYWQAIGVWLIYTVMAKIVVIRAMLLSNLWLAFIMVGGVAIIFGVVFLYLFRHERFIRFAKELENRERKKEKKWEGRLRHFGKITAVVIVGWLTGPLLAALAAKWLLRGRVNAYITVILACLVGAWFWLGVLRQSFSFGIGRFVFL